MKLSELKLKKGHIGLGDFIAGANIGKLRDIVDKEITITEIQKGNVKDKKTNTTKEAFAFKCDASDDVYISNVIIYLRKSVLQLHHIQLVYLCH